MSVSRCPHSVVEQALPHPHRTDWCMAMVAFCIFLFPGFSGQVGGGSPILPKFSSTGCSWMGAAGRRQVLPQPPSCPAGPWWAVGGLLPRLDGLDSCFLQDYPDPDKTWFHLDYYCPRYRHTAWTAHIATFPHSPAYPCPVPIHPNLPDYSTPPFYRTVTLWKIGKRCTLPHHSPLPSHIETFLYPSN